MTGPKRAARRPWPRDRAGWVVVACALAGLAFTRPAPGDLPPALDRLACGEPIRRQLEQWASQGDWRPIADAEARRWASPTARIGVWVVARAPARGGVAIYRIDAATTVEMTWDARCAAERHERPTVSAAGAPSGPFLDDAALAALLSDERPGVIYLWSPHMPLSVDAFHHAAAAARDLGIAFVPALDPMADPAYAAATARHAGLPPDALRRLDSVELTFRNLTLHAPSLHVFDAGVLIGETLPGYRAVTGYRTFIARQLDRSRR